MLAILLCGIGGAMVGYNAAKMDVWFWIGVVIMLIGLAMPV